MREKQARDVIREEDEEVGDDECERETVQRKWTMGFRPVIVLSSSSLAAS